MTHIDNISHIFQYGITHVTSPKANKNYMPIGDDKLISNRNSVVLANGKNLGQYIPFYFGYRMPMLYVIQNGFNSVKVTPAENIVYCVSTVKQIVDHNLSYIYSNGHAVDGLTEFFDHTSIARIDSIIDKTAIRSKYWKDESDLDLKRRKEAEFLVEADVPSTAIAGWVVYNLQAKARLQDIGITDSKIVVKPEFYF